MTDKELERAVNTCGKNFLAFHIEDIAERYEELAPKGSHSRTGASGNTTETNMASTARMRQGFALS